MATDDLFGVPKYTNGYVWNFKVTKGEGTATVGVKAVAIDKTLYVTEIDTTGAGKLVTDSAVISYVAQEINKLGKLELEVVSVLPTAGETTLGKIYLVSKGEEKTGYTEHITVKGGTEESPTYKWEEIGDTDVDLSNYYNKTEVDDLLEDKVDKVDGKGLSTNDFDNDYKTKLDGIASEATKTTIASKDTDDGQKITITNQLSEQDNNIEFTIPKPAYNTIIVETEDGTVQAVATEEKKSLTITAGDGIILEAQTAEDGGPSLNISIDTTDVIDIATTIPTDRSKDNAIPNVGAVKAYVDGHKGSSPTYNPGDGSIDLTV